MLTAQERVKNLPKVTIYEIGFGNIREINSFRLPVIESKPAIQWDVTPYIHVSLFFANFSSSSVFELVSEERSQQN